MTIFAPITYKTFFKWLQLDSNPQPLSSQTTSQPFSQIGLNDWASLWVLVYMVHLTVCSCHVTYTFQSESTLYSCLNVKGLLARSRRKIWSLSDCNWTRTHNHLDRKWKLNHLAKLARFTLKGVHDMTRTYSQIHRTDKYSQYSSII